MRPTDMLQVNKYCAPPPPIVLCSLKQTQDRERKLEEEVKEMAKPLARYADDEDLNQVRPVKEGWGTPYWARLLCLLTAKALPPGAKLFLALPFSFLASPAAKISYPAGGSNGGLHDGEAGKGNGSVWQAAAPPVSGPGAAEPLQRCPWCAFAGTPVLNHRL